MGAGKKTQNSELREAALFPNNVLRVSGNRDLLKSQLGGVIFGCTNTTIRECLSKQLFGLPGRHFSYVKNIEPGLPLFLFNYSDRKLYGIFEAVSCGQMNMNPYAWTGDGSERTAYPAQVQIRLRKQCQSLAEPQFKAIVADNYYNKDHFWFELDHLQASKLISKFSSLPPAPKNFLQQNALKPITASQRSTLTRKTEETGAVEAPSLPDDVINGSTGGLGSSDDLLLDDGDNQRLDAPFSNQVVDLEDKDLIYMKLKELALSHVYSSSTIMGHGADVPKADNIDLNHEAAEKGLSPSPTSVDVSGDPSLLAQLQQELEELNALKKEQSQKIESMEKKLAEAEEEICALRNRCPKLESMSNTSIACTVGTPMVTDELDLDLDEVIFLVGGCVGDSCSSALRSFSPSRDVVKPLKPMSHAKSQVSVAKLNGEFYVIGGFDGYMWCDTVESYNPVKNQWTSLPCLNEKKGSLASAAINGKIYVFGGGNGRKSFSEVEMFDLDVERWISTRSMKEKRFSLAAAELNGALYAVGGFNGEEYLKSAERFDPREHSWTKIASMNTGRGCPSVVALNEKLYAIGGFDGDAMVPSMEIYDPRLGTWMLGEPMKEGRGYFASVVFNETIYTFGGVGINDTALDKMEYYKEGIGWQTKEINAIGKWCCGSAFV